MIVSGAPYFSVFFFYEFLIFSIGFGFYKKFANTRNFLRREMPGPGHSSRGNSKMSFIRALLDVAIIFVSCIRV